MLQIKHRGAKVGQPWVRMEPGMTETGSRLEIAVLAGAVYAGCVFGVAFATGALRTLLLAMIGRLTPAGAVLIELPAILLAAWAICGWAIRSHKVSSAIGIRALMGLVAFALIVGVEAALTSTITGLGMEGVVASYQRPEVLLGLMGQVVFAAFPLVRDRNQNA